MSSSFPASSSPPRPRPGAGTPAGAPEFQRHPRYVDYGTPRAYDTSSRPTGGLTGTRHAPAQIHRPHQVQPASAWATQTRRIQDLNATTEAAAFSRIAMWIAVGVLVLATLAVLGMSFLGYVVGENSTPIMWPAITVLAGISLAVICAVMLLSDRWDPQPKGLLAVAVLWGASIAVFLSMLCHELVEIVVYALTGSEAAARFATLVGSAPIAEETSKALTLVLLLFLARRYFNGPLDGAIYGMLSGAGFAFSENILYYGRSFDENGLTGLGMTVFIRGVVGIFGHGIYTGLTGIVMGFVVRKWGTIPGLLSFIVAVIPGMFLHALWNFSTSLPLGKPGFIGLLAGEVLLSFVFLCLLGFLVWDEARLTRVRLGDYANFGWLTHEEVTMLATWKGRREGKRWAASMNAKPVMKRFIREAADLASIRQRLLADGQDPKAVTAEAALLQRLTANRQALLQYSGG